MQGNEFDGERAVLKVGCDKLRSFTRLALPLLASKWKEVAFRHEVGKAAFCCAFRSVLFSQLGESFPYIQQLASSG